MTNRYRYILYQTLTSNFKKKYNDNNYNHYLEDRSYAQRNTV